MSKKISVGTAVVLIILACVLTFQMTYIGVGNKFKAKLNEIAPGAAAFDKLAEVDSIYRSLYIGEIDEELLSDMIIRGYVVGTGDKYAYYLDKEQWKANTSDLMADTVGIGVYVINTADYIEVISVMPDSPALEAGLQPGDVIAYVGGESVAELGYNAAVSKMLGVEGTAAEFTVLRDGELIDFSVIRAHVNEQSVMSRVYESDPTVGIIRLLEFDMGTPKQFKEEYNKLILSDVTRIIFDVRYNPGGELESVCEVLDFLLPEGPIIRIVDADGNEEVVYSDGECADIPMAVLINGSTASAAELFAAALKDYEVAELVGTVTYGKGTMQRLIELPDSTGLAVSYRMYCPPFSDCYEGVGVEPDYVCELDESLLDKNIYKITDSEDNQLAKAVSVLDNLEISA